MEEWLSPFYKTTQDFKRWSQVTVMSKTISPLVGVGRHSAPDLGFHYGDSLVLLISPALTLDHYHHPSYFNSPYYFSFWASCPRTLVCPLLCSFSTPPPGSSRGWFFHTAECSAWVWSLRALPAQPSSSSAPTASLSQNSFLLFRTYNCLNDWFTSCWYPAPTWMSFLWDIDSILDPSRVSGTRCEVKSVCWFQNEQVRINGLGILIITIAFKLFRRVSCFIAFI